MVGVFAVCGVRSVCHRGLTGDAKAFLGFIQKFLLRLCECRCAEFHFSTFHFHNTTLKQSFHILQKSFVQHYLRTTLVHFLQLELKPTLSQNNSGYPKHGMVRFVFLFLSWSSFCLSYRVYIQDGFLTLVKHI